MLSLIFTCSLSASVYGQNYRVSMKKQNCSILEILKEIEKNSEFTFFFNDNKVNVNRKTSVDVKNASLDEVMKLLLHGTNYKYEIIDRQVLIKLKETNETSVGSHSRQRGKIITGSVKDESGMPVIGANVVVKGTTNGTITDLDGNFSLEVPENASLVVSYIGYTDKVLSVGNSTVLNISLTEEIAPVRFTFFCVP